MALVAVNKQSKKDVYSPLLDEIGRHSTTAPIKIIPINPNARVLAGFVCRVAFFIIGTHKPPLFG